MTRRATVLGTGLIGASLGIALRAAGWEVVGWDPDSTRLEAARGMGAVDAAAGGSAEAIQGADLVALAGPVPAIIETLRALDTDALVTDVAGVKLPVLEAGRHLPHFVPGHPMAGRETSGPAGASGSLFRGATWVLIDDEASDDDLDAGREIVGGLGAVPVTMSAAEHDAAVAAASHLPHVTAAALVGLVGDDQRAMALAAGGFRDLTRIAMSDPSWWIDVLVANAGPVVAELTALTDRLAGLAARIENADREGLALTLARAREIRSAMAPPVAGVGVLLEDRPGEIAAVGHALAVSHVDLRDLQLRHATHGGGGVLTLSVRADEADRLRSALRTEGFRLVETA